MKTGYFLAFTLVVFVSQALAIDGQLPVAGGVDAQAAENIFTRAQAEKDTAKHRDLLVQASKLGSIKAAARMVDLSAMSELRNFSQAEIEALAVWTKEDMKIGSKWPVQIYGSFLAAWANQQFSKPKAERMKTILEARTFLLSKPLDDPGLLLDASWLASLEPSDSNMAETCRKKALMLLTGVLPRPQPGLDLAAREYMKGICLQKFLQKSDNDTTDEEAAKLFNSALANYERCGDKFGQARSLRRFAECVIHYMKRTKKWDPDFASPALEKAEKLFLELEDKEGLGLCLMAKGSILLSESDSAGNIPDSQFAKAIQIYQKASEAFSQMGDKRLQASCLHNQGLAKKHSKGSKQEYFPLFQRAADLRREAGDEAGAKVSESEMN